MDTNSVLFDEKAKKTAPDSDPRSLHTPRSVQNLYFRQVCLHMFKARAA